MPSARENDHVTHHGGAMLTSRMVRLWALGVLLGALPLAGLGGQTASESPSSRPSIDNMYMQLRFAGDARALRAEGIGARLMWSSVPLVGGAGALADRTDVGLYATFTP